MVVMNNKTLVAYFTKGGASEKYAQIISDTLTSDGLTVETCNLANNIPDITSYNIIVLGTGVRIFRVYRQWKKILKQKSLRNKNLFMFLSSGTAIEDPKKAVEKFLQPLVEKYNLMPKSIISFPGKIPDKWAKLDDQKDTIKPDKAKGWANEIAQQFQIK